MTINWGELSAAQFLREFWQQKPLLLRAALPDWQLPLDADELAGLACEAVVEARIVSGNAEAGWRVQPGPFPEDYFTQLGEHDWTLLVQAVDHYVPEVRQLLGCFRFIPDWRVDDVMVSFAVDGGSVGPHFDRYDVFLLQGEGQRSWQVGGQCDAGSALRTDSELQVLRDFEPHQQYLLDPGDMLYLPPGIAHWGQAKGPCQTYSIGFRAPSHAELLEQQTTALVAGLDEDRRFVDIARTLPDHPAEIGKADIDVVKRMVAGLVQQTDAGIADWFGRLVTETRYDNDVDKTASSMPAAEVLYVTSSSRLAYSCHAESTVLYANGESWRGTGATWRQFIQRLCQDRRITLHEYENDPHIAKTCMALFAHNIVDAGD